MSSHRDGQSTWQRHAPLYDPAFERDACGVGLVVDIKGRPARAIVERALGGLVNLTHRGGVGADSRTGDGAGILTQIPAALFADDLARNGAAGLGPGEFAVAMLFLPQETAVAAAARRELAATLTTRGLELIGCARCRSIPPCSGTSRPRRSR